MAHTSRGQYSPPSYLDGIPVKISEKYKPPKRISLALSYSQIMALNKLVQEPLPTYDFSLEESVKIRVNEWRKVRSTLAEERKQRLQIINQERQSKNWSSSENAEPTEVLRANQSNSDSDTASSDLSTNKDSTPELPQKSGPYYSTESGVLIPMMFPSQQTNDPIPVYQIEKGFNFSEFESDTSSPFDNMELKTINDLEELAEVLKRNSDKNSPPVVHNTTLKDTSNLTNVIENNYINSSTVHCSENIYDNAYNIITNSSSKDTVHVNGFYFNHTPFSSSKPAYDSHVDLQTTQARDSNVRTVTEIMKSLEEELANNHVSEVTTVVEAAAAARKPPEGLSANRPVDNSLDNPFGTLNTEQRDTTVAISKMGFPLPRVARACVVFEGNQKKIVEHLLAMQIGRAHV